MVAVSLLSLACGKYDHAIGVSDVRKKEVIVLKNEPKQGPVYAIRIRGRGNITGEATISLMHNGGAYRTERLRGRASFRWGGDWYSDTAEIRYEPIHVDSGELTIEYQFSTLK